MRLFASLLAFALVCAASSAAHADSINFSVTGGDGAFSFSLPSTAIPTSSTSLYTVYGLATATGNGYTAQNDTLYLYSPIDGGGLSLHSANGLLYLNEYGPQVFSGTPSNPFFQNGTFTLTSGSSSINGAASSANGDVLTISVVPSISPVPEPSTLLLFGTGVLSLAGVGRRIWQA